MVRLITFTRFSLRMAFRTSGDGTHVALGDFLPILRIDKDEGQDAEFAQMLQMYPGKPFHDHRLEAQIAGSQDGVLSARTLPVIGAAYDERALLLTDHGSCVVGLVDLAESKLAEFQDIAAERQRLGPGRHDAVSGDIIRHFQ